MTVGRATCSVVPNRPRDALPLPFLETLIISTYTVLTPGAENGNNASRSSYLSTVRVKLRNGRGQIKSVEMEYFFSFSARLWNGTREKRWTHLSRSSASLPPTCFMDYRALSRVWWMWRTVPLSFLLHSEVRQDLTVSRRCEGCESETKDTASLGV